MKIKLTTTALFAGLFLGLGPWVFFVNPSPWWYLVSVFGGLLVAIAGYGAQMEQLHQGNTGEELLQSAISWVKRKLFK